MLGRRRLLQCTMGLLAAPALSRLALAQPTAPVDPFLLGVASGSPLPDGVVIWTRLVHTPLLPDGGMGPTPARVGWEVANDENFASIVKRGTFETDGSVGHSVHVDVRGLAPARWYWYRFHYAGATSPVGRTRTAPAAGAPADRLRFAFASCAQYEHGYYAAYRHMAAESLDLVVFLGDYIYETSWGRNLVRHYDMAPARTLANYRARYALHRLDDDLRAAHASAPWIVTWDDHEVANDYANLRDEALDPDFRARRAAGYQAFWEHMPLRGGPPRDWADLRLYARYDFGDLARFHMLDDRQYRAVQACTPTDRGGGGFVEDCADRLRPERSLLGPAQERWLEDGLAASRARWNVLGQQTLMAQLDRRPGPGTLFWTDGWDGYPAARRKLLAFIAARRPNNPLVIGGDVHSTWAADLKPDFDDPRSPVVASEICGTSITSQGPQQARMAALLADNPHIKFFDAEQRGYVRVELTRAAARADLRTLDDVRRPDARIATAASFVVAAGRAGVQRG